MVRFEKYMFVCMLSLLLTTQGQAAKLASGCWTAENSKDVVGRNIDTLMPIASVSKVYSTLMAATEFNLDDKFYTQIYVTAVSQDLFDVHIKGSRDPYFNKFKMHMIISKLNEMNVKKIRNLTFDENVKYLHETDLSSGFRVGKTLVQPLVLKADLEFPSPGLVSAELSQIGYILKTYPQSYKLAAANGITLFKNPSLKITKILYLPTTKFKITSEMQKIFVASQNIRTILKSMNWNSNNHAANQVFMASGGLSKFNKLYYKDFAQSEKDVVFVNGSGQNHDLTGTGRLYNEATCRNVVRTLQILSRTLKAQKLELQDVMSVVGSDRGSTVGGAAYTNALTTGAVIAKTGTVGTNIALAGLANTKLGLKYFMYNVELGFPPTRSKKKKAWANQEANRARSLISLELQKLMKANGGPVKFKYEPLNPLNDNLENYDEETIAATSETEPDEEGEN